MALILRTQINRKLTAAELDNNFTYLEGLSGSGGGLEEVTFSELTTLISGSNLQAGTFYKITDYQTIYDQPDYDSLGDEKISVATKTGSVEELCVLAISVNVLSEWAYSPSFPKDMIKYDVTFTQTEIMSASAKGRITERIDDKGNRTPFDMRSVLFKRYESSPGSGVYNSYKDNGNASQEFLTFEDSNSYDNYIGDQVDFGNFLLNNTTFQSEVKGFKSGNNFANNTILGSCENSKFGSDCYNNIIGTGFDNNQIGDMFQENIIQDGFQDNHILNGFSNNQVLDDFIGNKIGNNFNNNQIGQNGFLYIYGYGTGFATFTKNHIGEDFKDNLVGENFSNNKIGNGFDDNTISNNFTNNVIGNDFASNVIGNGFQYNKVDELFAGNLINDDFQYNKMSSFTALNLIDSSFNSNTMLDTFFDNQTASGFSYNIGKTEIEFQDFTSSTLVYQPFTCDIIREPYFGDLYLTFYDTFAPGLITTLAIT